MILLTHLGRNPKTTLEVLAQKLREYVEVTYVPALIGDAVTEAINAMQDGDVIVP